MKKLIMLLGVLVAIYPLFADLEIDIPFDPDVIGPAHNGTNYTFESEHFNVINNGVTDDFTLTVVSPDLPDGWGLMWCHELDGDGSCHLNSTWDFVFPSGSTLDLDFIITVGSADQITITYTFESASLPEPVVITFTFRTEDFSAADDFTLDEREFHLSNYPNPFWESTAISFDVPQSSRFVSLDIYNIKGQKVRNFSNLQIDRATDHQIEWDGTDENGSRVLRGTYFYKLNTGNSQIVKKMTIW